MKYKLCFHLANSKLFDYKKGLNVVNGRSNDNI